MLREANGAISEGMSNYGSGNLIPTVFTKTPIILAMKLQWW